jgi:hypothetical protein
MDKIGVNRGCESLSGYISGIVAVRPGWMAAREAGLVGVKRMGFQRSTLDDRCPKSHHDTLHHYESSTISERSGQNPTGVLQSRRIRLTEG